jgi:hypothetical protein
MSTSKKPLKPDDFPVNAEGQKIKKQDGTPIANTEDPAVAADVAERLNDDGAKKTSGRPDRLCQSSSSVPIKLSSAWCSEPLAPSRRNLPMPV